MSVMDNDFQLNVSISKALSPSEAPLKMKHARSVIIATHRHRGAKSFWAITTRQPLMEHRFTAWKFCHVLHKVLREGHENCLRHSQVHKTLILEVGKLWGHLQDGVGKCIESYTVLLVNKLEFHQKNLGIPGSITMDFTEIRKVTGDDLNNYFQLCVEIFDYLDHIITLQSVIFTSVNTYRMSSMTPQGQCRLAPLITLIQDSNPLYDLCVRVLFRLHNGLPHDILLGHRNRFNELFSKLKIFYETVRPLQYFSDVIQLPHLPDHAPNFSSEIDVGNYVPPVMHVYQQEEELPVEESLLDLSQTSDNSTPVPVENEVDESQIIIASLQEELRVRQMHIEHLANATKEMSNLRVRNEALESEITITKEMLQNTTLIKDNLEMKLKEMEDIEVGVKDKVKEGDEKCKQVEEKFEKIKTMYGKLREDHIQLLRMRNDDSKHLMAARKNNEVLQTEINNLRHQVEDHVKTEDHNTHLKAKITELEDLISKKDQQFRDVESELIKSKTLFEKHDLDKNAIINEHESQMMEQKMELRKLRENYDIEVQTKQHELNELMQVKLNSETSMKDLEQQLEKSTIHSQTLEQNIAVLNAEIEQTKFKTAEELKFKQDEINELLNTKLSNESSIIGLQQQIENSQKTNENLTSKIGEMSLHVSQLHQDLQRCTTENDDLKRNEQNTKEYFESFVTSVNKLLHENMNENFMFDYFELTAIPDHCENNIRHIKNLMQKIQNDYKCKVSDISVSGRILSSTIELSYSLKMFHEYIMLIFSNSTDMAKVDELRDECSVLRQSVLELYQVFVANQDPDNIDKLCNAVINIQLSKIQNLIKSLQNSFSESLNVGDMLQKELKDMDSIIEEATKQIMDMLLSTKSQHEGIKLEVNEKILDSCTNLMHCIVLLIQSSRELQNEIVSKEKGTFSAKEFYKRNSQWTEGLISASKSIAKGAKYLVDAANKTIDSESSECFELIVAAQEIAASTAQLVIASKVKAKNDSQNLVNLTKASRDVSVATGQVVATVRDGNSKLEYKNEIDVSKLTPSQKKTMEMEMQIKVLQLEHSLQSQQQKLMSFRKAFYQSADDD